MQLPVQAPPATLLPRNSQGPFAASSTDLCREVNGSFFIILCPSFQVASTPSHTEIFQEATSTKPCPGSGNNPSHKTGNRKGHKELQTPQRCKTLAKSSAGH